MAFELVKARSNGAGEPINGSCKNGLPGLATDLPNDIVG